MATKKQYVNDYFEQLEEDLGRAQALLGDANHYLDAILLLSCHIGSYGSLRYPNLRDNESYKNVVLEYSGKREFYEQIDLLFFCQWPRSEFKEQSCYRALRNHSEIANIINGEYGDEDAIGAGSRYISPNTFLELIDRNSFNGYDHTNLKLHLPLFNLSELLYRYVRCLAVHNNQFPFVTKVHITGNGIRYRDNHAITGAVLKGTASNILTTLKDECIQEGKWPWEL